MDSLAGSVFTFSNLHWSLGLHLGIFMFLGVCTLVYRVLSPVAWGFSRIHLDSLIPYVVSVSSGFVSCCILVTQRFPLRSVVFWDFPWIFLSCPCGWSKLFLGTRVAPSFFFILCRPTVLALFSVWWARIVLHLMLSSPTEWRWFYLCSRVFSYTVPHTSALLSMVYFLS